ncbi:MAG: isoprenylcysteine carboxylmethyltransferase family protein, partial [Planctomycetes bacterium]|nr:isoprenylcysteine carboxylmethyltransferase family protein [Planctomycetota bacterium]
QEVMGSLDPDTRTLICNGPFAMLRNPLYLGSLLVFSGMGVSAGAPIAIALAVFHWVRYERVIRFEEENLRAEWGPEFDRYCEQVPRWIPRFRRLLRKSPHADMSGVLANGLFAGIWIGSLIAMATGELWTLYLSEIVGGAVMATWHATVGRTAGSTAAQPQPIAVDKSRQAA